jgi:serine/threonine protein kinase
MKLTKIADIDAGGFGSVDLVEDEHGSRFARKRFSKNQPMSDELLENVKRRFAKEIRIQGAIKHRNIVPIFHANLDADPPYYLMPVANQSLSKDLLQDKTLGGKFTAAVGDIVAGLEVLHALQIYHRDLKPQNVLRFSPQSTNANTGANSDYYAISDFGLVAMKESQLSSLTSTGMARGSDYYTAPEITQDLRLASVQSDVYSLGCIIHDMVGTSSRIPCGEIREAGPYAAVLLGCTRKDPSARFKSARAVLDSILSIDAAAATSVTQASIDFIAALDSSDLLADDFWRRLADYLEFQADDRDKREILIKLTLDRISDLRDASSVELNRIAIIFANWVFASAFNFEFCDPLANRLEAFINCCDFEAKSACIIAMLELGTSHNRWYVERKFMDICSSKMEPNLAERLGIEFRILGNPLCRMIAHLERSITVQRSDLHESLQRAIAEVCKS